LKPKISSITDIWIQENDPCSEALAWWDKKESSPLKILQLLIKDQKYDWANWFIVRIMEYTDYVAYAIFAAEQVIANYEKQYPNDPRPRNAIAAAELCVKDPSEKNKNAAAYATNAAANAAYAAYAAAYVAYATNAAYAANAATNAAYAAAYAANAATNAAANAAYAAYAAAYVAAYAAYAATNAAANAAYAAYAANAAMKRKILEYGILLLKK
jgi:hypothetical protein